MASKDELRKQQRTLQRRPRSNAPSYTMDETGELKPESTQNIVETTEKMVVPTIDEAFKKAESLVSTTEKKVEEPKPEKTEEKVVLKQESPQSEKVTPAKDEIVKSVTVRLVDVDDADYLKYGCKANGQTMQEFFWDILKNDIENNNIIDPKDDEHKHYKMINLPEIRTIPIPKTLKEKIGVTAGKHRMAETRYMAMVINKARINDPTWN